MGLSFGKIWERFMGKKEMRILMVGLDAAGACARDAVSLGLVGLCPEYLRSRGPCRPPSFR